MRAAGAREDGVSRADVERLAVDCHLATAAEDVVDLILLLQVVADSGAWLEGGLPENQLHPGRFIEEGVANCLSSTIVRTGFLFRDVAVALEDVASRRLLCGGC